MIADWCDQYDPAAWMRVPTTLTGDKPVRMGIDKQSDRGVLQWKHRRGNWAGEAYEQGAFVRALLPKRRRYGIHPMPYYVFSEVECTRPHHDSLCVHMYGMHVMQECESEQCVHRRTAFRLPPQKEKLPVECIGARWCVPCRGASAARWWRWRLPSSGW